MAANLFSRLERFREESQVIARLEICQRIYTTRFSDEEFYTLKVRNLRLAQIDNHVTHSVPCRYKAERAAKKENIIGLWWI